MKHARLTRRTSDPREADSRARPSLDPWLLVASEPRAELLYLANGYMGVALGWDGGVLFESEPCPCYVRGVYTLAGPDRIDRLAVLPCWSHLRYGAPSELREYERRLDLHRGMVDTQLTLEEARGIIHITQRIFVSRANAHLAAVSLTITPEFDGEITFITDLEAPRSGDLEVIEAGAAMGEAWLRGRIAAHDIQLAAVLSYEGKVWAVAHEAVRQMDVSRTLVAEGSSGSALTLVQMASLATSLESDEPLTLARCSISDYAGAERDHQRAWERLWKTDIEIEGDAKVQQFARAALFYLWSTVAEGDRWSIAPMGLSSNVYNGHIFWDAELWMYPSLLVTQPELASACVSYRERTLDAARERAAATGYHGAQYPWEGGFTGDEVTPHWAATRDFELHITADVAIGQWWYFLNTGDVDWLRHHGFPVIRACAEFWVSRVEHDADHDRYEISNVVCADEYAEHVNNNAFTNAAVQRSLRIASRAAQILGEPVPDEWRTIADRMYIPFDQQRRIHLEYDGYDGRVTKQADVELLSYPLESTTDSRQVARDLDFYRSVIDPQGPAMSYSVYSILSAQLGRAADAYEYLLRSFIPNTRPPFWSFSETPTNNDFFFCTGLGGALQAVLFGFTGLRLQDGFFVLRPLLPEHWPALRLRGLFIAGARTDLEIEPGRLRICRHNATHSVALTVLRDFEGVPAVGEIEGPEDLELEIATARGEVLQRASAGEQAYCALPALSQGARLRLVHQCDCLLDVLLLRLP